jgi:regulation of enolase protein 1 (concanavalin A-like superfamily)
MSIVIDGLPPVLWTNGDGEAEVHGDTLRITAAAGTDWTNDVFGGAQQHAATALACEPIGDFVLSARVQVPSERTTFDAGVLAIWGDKDHWAKICFEFSPQGQAMVVSVVTNDFSDDCNSTVVSDKWIYLRVLRSGTGWAFHSSPDGSEWSFVRVFQLNFDGPLRVGFMSQAPNGDECIAEFDHIRYTAVVPADLRNGS